MIVLKCQRRPVTGTEGHTFFFRGFQHLFSYCFSVVLVLFVCGDLFFLRKICICFLLEKLSILRSLCRTLFYSQDGNSLGECKSWY